MTSWSPTYDDDNEGDSRVRILDGGPRDLGQAARAFARRFGPGDYLLFISCLVGNYMVGRSQGTLRALSGQGAIGAGPATSRRFRRTDLGCPTRLCPAQAIAGDLHV